MCVKAEYSYIENKYTVKKKKRPHPQGQWSRLRGKMPEPSLGMRKVRGCTIFLEAAPFLFQRRNKLKKGSSFSRIRNVLRIHNGA